MHLFAKIICFALIATTSVFSLNVNRINGGGTVIYVDFSLQGDVVPLVLERTYNSITSVNESTAWIGAFGWGWTSDFESVLTTTPDRSVLLRDGKTGNTIIFQPRKDNPAAKKAFFEKIKKAYYARKIGRAPKPAELKKYKLPSKFYSRLRTDAQFRIQMAVEYGIQGEVPKGELLVSTQYGYQTIQFKGNRWIRRKDGWAQHFDKQGRLVRSEDRNGYYIDYKYAPGKLRLKEIVSRNKVSSLKFTWIDNRVTRITDNQGRYSSYSYDKKGNLTKVVDSTGQTYVYKYQNSRYPHLLTRIVYPDESSPGKEVYREIRYDRGGSVVYHRDKIGAVTKYVYGKKPNDPGNNFWTKTIYERKASLSKPDERYEEFFLKKRVDGSKYLYKQIGRSTFKVGGKRQTFSETIIFTACCGKPSQIIRGGQVTKFKYYANGLLKERIGPRESVKIEYESKFMKVSKVVKNGKVSRYGYDGRGNLVTAHAGSKKVNLKYDRLGRILRMSDVKGGHIKFKYGSLGKPVIIEQKGVGTIQISYDNLGKIRKTATLMTGRGNRKPSATESKRIVKRVMTGFQNLLDIIRPAAQVNKALPLAWRVNDR